MTREFDSFEENEIRHIAQEEGGGVDGEDISPASVDTPHADVGSGSVGDAVVGPFHPDLEITNILGGNRNPNNKPALIPTDGDRLVLVYRDAPSHEYSEESVIRMLWSNDKGKSWYNHRMVYDPSTAGVEPIAPGGGQLDNGRIGFFVGRRTAETDFVEPAFVYSDDDGDTWNTTIMADTAVSFGRFRRFPSSVGGADDGGWIIFSYDRDTQSIVYFSTTDNGDTWTRGEAYDYSGDTGRFIEHSVVRLDDSDRWMMFSRSSELNNLHLFTSENLTDWSGPHDTGQPLDENQPQTGYYNGHIYVMAASRGYFNREIADYGDALLHQSAPAEAVWSDPTAWSDWEVAYRPRGTINAYGEIREIDGEWMGVMSVSEDQGRSSMIGLLRQSESTDPNMGIADFHIKDGFRDQGGNPSAPWNRPASVQSNYPTLYSNLVTARYRPAWMFDPLGGPVIAGNLSIPAYDGESAQFAHTVSELDAELSLQFDFTLDEAASDGSLAIFPQTERPDEPIDSGTGGYYVAIRSSGDLTFSKRSGGNSTELISGTWDNDTNRHSIELTRSAVGDEWELIYDGTSIGTATDSETFNPNIVFRNQLDAGVSIHHLLVTE